MVTVSFSKVTSWTIESGAARRVAATGQRQRMEKRATRLRDDCVEGSMFMAMCNAVPHGI